MSTTAATTVLPEEIQRRLAALEDRVRDLAENFSVLLESGARVSPLLSAGETRVIRARQIIARVAGSYGLHPVRLCGRARDARTVEARWLAIWLCYSALGMRTGELARVFARDASAITHALHGFRERIKAGRPLRDSAEEWLATIRGGALGAEVSDCPPTTIKETNEK